MLSVLFENRSVMLDRAENLLHDHYGGKEYWNVSARRRLPRSPQRCSGRICERLLDGRRLLTASVVGGAAVRGRWGVQRGGAGGGAGGAAGTTALHFGAAPGQQRGLHVVGMFACQVIGLLFMETDY